METVGDEQNSADIVMKKFCQNVALVLIALLLCLLSAEVAVRVIFHCVPNYDFEMWRYAAELKQPLPTAALPFHHWANRGGRYYGVDIKTNSLGMRDREVAAARTPGSRRVVILGDSYALGWGVPQEETFSRLLEQLLNKEKPGADVINLGTGNYNSAMEVELFKQKGLALNPDLVVLMYYINDVEPTPGLGRVSYWLQKHFYLLGFMRTKVHQLVMMGEGSDWLESYYRKIYGTGNPGLQQNRQALQELAALCRSKNTRLLMVNIPDLRRLESYPFTFATDFIRSIAEENRVPFLDLLPLFGKHPGKSLWVSDDDSHTNGRANGLASQAIFDRIRVEGLLDAR
jgi:lysophospholipase L1-like esterase